MGRLLNEFIAVEGTLKVVGGLHIGNLDEELSLDMSLARAGNGKLYLPGTSLAGALRQWWYRNFKDTFKQVWGDTDEGDQPRASLIHIHDAPSDIETPLTEIRDGVGIDRYTAAAADKAKFDREIVTADSTFSLRIELEIPFDQKLDEQVEIVGQFAAMLQALEEGKIRFGGAKSRGLGKVRLKNGKASRENRKAPEDLLRRLQNPDDVICEDSYNALLAMACDLPADNSLSIKIEWTSSGPVMSSSSFTSILVDTFPLTTAKGKEQHLVLPASSIKGVLRSHCERIIRTLGNSLQDSQDFHLQITGFAGSKLIDALFGKKPKKKAADGRMGALFIEDCFPVVPAIERSKLEKLLTSAPEAQENEKADAEKTRTARNLLEDTGWKEFYPSTHNAIDRWTGSVADQALFNQLLPTGAGTSTIEMTLDTGWLPDEIRAEAIALLLILLRDMKNGHIPLGFGVNRGLGTLNISKVEIRGSGSHEDLDGEINALHGGVLENIALSWNKFAEGLWNNEEAA